MATYSLKRKKDTSYDKYENIDHFDTGKRMKVGERFFLMPVHLVTCGFQGEQLGRDETSILQICIQIIDGLSMEIVGEKNILLKPSSFFDEKIEPEKIYISVSAKDMINLNSETYTDSTITFREAIDSIDHFINLKTTLMDQTHVDIIPVTVGHLPLRSAFHREARFRKVTLPQYWYHFFDICEQVSLCFKSSVKSLVEICSVLQLINNENSLGIILNISQATLYLLKCNHEFCSKQIVMTEYKPAVFHINDHIEEDVVVMIKPIDYKTPISQVLPFFNGVNIADGGIAVIMSEGRRSNKILVRFVDKIQRDIALLRDKHHLDPGNSKYITICPFESTDFMKIAGYEDDLIKNYLIQLTSQAQSLLKMKGLPFTVTKADILNFFLSNGTFVQLGQNAIFLVQKQSGDLNGDAFIILNDEEQTERAISLKGSLIGNRYIEIFHSTPAEMNQVIAAIKSGVNHSKMLKKYNRNKETEKNYALPQGNKSSFFGLNPGIPQNHKTDSVGSATVTTLIPKEATDNDFINYLGEFYKICIVVSRYNLNNPKGYTTYIAGFKNINDAELVSNMLLDKRFVMEMMKEEFSVKIMVLPLTSGSLQKTTYLHNPLVQKVSAINFIPTILSFPPSMFHSCGIQNPLQISNINLGTIPNLCALNQYNQMTLFPNFFQSRFFNSHIPSQYPIQLSPTSLDMNNLNPKLFLPNSFDERFSTLMLLGVQIPLFQIDSDTIFQLLIPYIKALPKLYQSNQIFFAMFITPQDANVALMRCPIISYKNQTIQLVSID